MGPTNGLPEKGLHPKSKLRASTYLTSDLPSRFGSLGHVPVDQYERPTDEKELWFKWKCNCGYRSPLCRIGSILLFLRDQQTGESFDKE